MKLQGLSVKRLFFYVTIGLILSMTAAAVVLYFITEQAAVLAVGGVLILCALAWLLALTQILGKKLALFTSDLCGTLDNMIAGNKGISLSEDSETQLARIGHRMARLYQIMQEDRRRVEEDRQELQSLVSDISHQVKTPVSNLKMATDTLLEKPMTEAERTDFIRGIRTQTDKLDFLFQALVKTSRLETGVIQLDKKVSSLYDTVAQAMSGIVYAAEKKEISVSVNCPEKLMFSHDSKWTAEALFNLLDNAVKYTSAGGKISVSVVQWEMYVEIKVADNGKGISESNQAAIAENQHRKEKSEIQEGRISMRKIKFLSILLVLSMLLTVPAFAFSSDFTDVPEETVYAESVSYLANAGILRGTASGRFSPNEKITISQWATMLCRALDEEPEGTSWQEVSTTAVQTAVRKAWLQPTAIGDETGFICRSDENSALRRDALRFGLAVRQ